MPIDPSIALQVQKPADPLQQAAQAMTLKHLSDQSALQPLQMQAAQQNLEAGALKNQQMQKQMAEADAMKRAFVVGDDGKLDAEATFRNMSKVNPQIANEWFTTKLKSDESLQKSLQERHQRVTTDMANLAGPIQVRIDELVASGVPLEAAFEKVKPLLQGSIGHLKELYPKDIDGDMSKVTPESLRQMAMQNPTYMKAHMDKQGAQSAEGKIEADFKAGRLTRQQRDDALKKKDYIRPVINVNTAPAERNTPEREKQVDYWADVLKTGGSLPPGLARNRDGAALVKDVMKRVAQGDTSPQELVSRQAELQGQKAGQRALGTRTANIEMAVQEAKNVMPIALAASEKVDRTKYPTLNSVLMAAEKGTGDEGVVQLGVATNSLINIYARAIAPSGTPTVSDKDHAREILSTAYSKGQYKSAVDMMQKEMDAAQKSPRQVKENMREEFTGKGNKSGISTDDQALINKYLKK